jgi:lipopolysaccharide transport system ATP-binding protein
MSAIIVDQVSKRYVISHQQTHDTLRDTLSQGAKSLWSRLSRRAPLRAGEEEFWALRDVSFQVEPGQVVGIIGRNGAGKSTLLKILSRISEPTTGRIKLLGRVASLLEVGTGFHPELTGRENVFLNGAILGMSRVEIRQKFDEIVAFAEVERFLDTPVKRYSSGMYVRLAFAVAAHLEPEILIVDEVLAVGDVAFQKKCVGKMQAVSKSEGRTVLFVSHNLASIRQLCGSAILLAGGRVQAVGACHTVLDTYQHGLAGAAPTDVPKPSPDLLDRAYTTAVHIETVSGGPLTIVPVGRHWRIRLRIRVAKQQEGFVAAVGLKSSDGTSIQTAWIPPRNLAPGDYEAIFTQDRVVLEAGSYTVIVGLSERDRSLQQFEAARIDVTAENAEGYYAATSGVGAVLNSMQSDFRSI